MVKQNEFLSFFLENEQTNQRQNEKMLILFVILLLAQDLIDCRLERCHRNRFG